MIFRQKDIVLLSYPFTNLQEKKVRPALIVSNDDFNVSCDNVLMLPLTSQIKEITSYAISITQNDMKNGKLVKSGMIRIDKLFSIEKRLIRMKIGNVTDAYFSNVRKELIGAL